jgi:glycosyltransferase involved in cell wall biosynthesis
VLLVAPQPFYQDRGTPIAVRQVVEGLGQLGYPVDLLTYPVGADIEAPGLRLIRAANPFGFKNVPVGLSIQKILLDLPLTLALLRQLGRGGYTCVHAVEEAAFPAVLLGRRYRVPVIYDMQSSLPEQLVTRVGFRSLPMRLLANRLERWVLAKADFVVSSAGLESRVRRIAPDARVREWHYPSVTVHAAETDEGPLRRRLAISPDVPVVLYGGTFESYQGLTELVQAIPLVRARVPAATFVLVGANKGSGNSIRAQAASLIQAGALRIIDRQPRHEISSYFRMADVLVSPRLHGGNLPLKVFDYLAAGRPIVATDIPTHRTVLNEQRAVLVPPHTSGLAEGILSLLDDPERAVRLGRAARAYAEEHLGWTSFVASLGQLYEEVHRHAPVVRS